MPLKYLTHLRSVNSQSVLHAFRKNNREDLVIEFDKRILCSTLYSYEVPKEKIGAYVWDIAFIFYSLNVDVCFVDEEDEVI